MKKNVEIEMLEKNIFRAREQAAFLRHTLNSVDEAIQISKQRLEEEIEVYNARAKRDQEILAMHDKNIAEWSKKLDKLLTKEIKIIDKEKVKIIPEKSEKQRKKESLEAKKRMIAEDLKKAKEELDLLNAEKELRKEEKAEITVEIPDSSYIHYKDTTATVTKEIIEPEPEPNKTECPECHEYFTKGGAFAAHYKSHFPNGNTDE